MNQLLGIVGGTATSNSFCTTSKNLESLNKKCQTLYPNLAPTVGVKEVNKAQCSTGGDQVVCGSGYFMKNKLSSSNAQVVGCNPISSNFNTICQNKFGRRVGYKDLSKKGCKAGYQWATCSPLYSDGFPVYDRDIPITLKNIDTDDNPLSYQVKATDCYPDNNMKNFTDACRSFGNEWKVNSFVGAYCKPGNLRALCAQSSTGPSTAPGNGTSSSNGGPYLPNSCPCTP